METMNTSFPHVTIRGPEETNGNAAELEDFKRCVDEMFTKVDEVRFIGKVMLLII